MSLATSFIYAIIAGILPSLVWLWFWMREDTHSEPRWLLVVSFMGGMLAVVAAIFAEKIISDNVTDRTLLYTLWAATEEILKFAVVVAIALRSSYDREPIQAMIYCVVVALGFAALENTLFLMGPLSGGAVAQGIITGNMRFVGATLVHIVSSAIIGFSVGMTFYCGYIAKFLSATAGLAVAIAAHAAFNIAIVNSSGTDALRTFGWVWGAVVILIVLFEEVKAVRPSDEFLARPHP